MIKSDVAFLASAICFSQVVDDTVNLALGLMMLFGMILLMFMEDKK